MPHASPSMNLQDQPACTRKTWFSPSGARPWISIVAFRKHTCIAIIHHAHIPQQTNNRSACPRDRSLGLTRGILHSEFALNCGPTKGRLRKHA